MNYADRSQPTATRGHLAQVLVVDDERNIRLMVRTSLETVGYAVEEAANGQIAFDAIRARPFDLVILDLNMPTLDGLGLLERLSSEHGPDVKGAGVLPRFIVLTAHGSIAAAVKATRLGALDFVEKPVTPDELRNTVMQVLTAPQLAAATWAKLEPVDYGQNLKRVQQALRVSDFATAEAMLMRAADLGEHDAAYFNLLGVIYELRHQSRLAKKFYGRAYHADTGYEPAQQNLRRVFELESFGQTAFPPALGDGADALASLLHQQQMR